MKWLGPAMLALSATPGWATQQTAPAPPAASFPAPAPPRPGIWLLADADTKIYLFGTYHILPQGFDWRSPLFDDIVRRADELVVEVTEADARANIAEALRHLQLGKEAPIAWRVSPGRRRALAEMMESLGLPAQMFDGMQTWSVAMALAVAQIARGMSREEGAAAAPAPANDGAAPAAPAEDATPEAGAARPPGMSGVEAVLEAEFRAAGRPISGVETVAQQMGFLSSMSFAEQRRMLEAMVDAYRKGLFDQPVDIGEGAWAGGDVDSIAMRQQGEMGGAFYETILPRRNAAWTIWLADRLERPGTLLFAVGAAHLAGRDSVQRMLGARGLRVRRIQ
jgi:uncharacterized protein